MKYEYINHECKKSFFANFSTSVSFTLSFIFLISFLCSIIIHFISKNKENNIEFPFLSIIKYFRKEKNVKDKIQDMYIDIFKKLNNIKNEVNVVYSIDKEYITAFLNTIEEYNCLIINNYSKNKSNKYINLTDSTKSFEKIDEEVKEEEYIETKDNAYIFKEYFIKFLKQKDNNKEEILLLYNDFQKYKEDIKKKINEKKINENIILKTNKILENNINMFCDKKIDINIIIYNNIKFIHEKVCTIDLFNNVTVKFFKIDEKSYYFLTEAIILFEIKNKIFNNYTEEEIIEVKKIKEKKFYNEDEYIKICDFIDKFQRLI